MKPLEIPYYQDYLSPSLLQHLEGSMRAVPGVDGLMEVGTGGGLETPEALRFLCELYDELKADLGDVLAARIQDREFIDQRTRACYELNRTLRVDFLDPQYETLIGQEDANGRVVIGPKNEFYCRAGYGKPVAAIPEFLSGNHVTLFGPPDDAKLSINAMNAYHRKLKEEPAIVAELLATSSGPGGVPKWGADDEDSKTPLRRDLVSAGENLSHCLSGDLSYIDPKSGKTYSLAEEKRSRPIKRFPGLALPSLFLFYKGNPLPLHLYDFALHFYKNWQNPEALAFYVPKLETEEEAAYIRKMVEAAERKIKEKNTSYQIGTVRLLIVLENPRAIFRTNEIMDALYPYFAGASLGWHDYLASTARLFKEDANYRIPVKADPNIVINYIKGSHDLLNHVVGSRGGIKIGGMYGVLPMEGDLWSPSFQITMKGFFKDVVTQLKRDLSGFWVAHPDFVRIGIAVIQAWKFHLQGDSKKLEALVKGLLLPEYHDEILGFITGPDLVGLSVDHPLYPRSLLVADLQASTAIANHDPEEIRYNVFQSLQYLTDWLSGNGCVALPAEIGGIPVRVMDDLATAERSRWEVWHEIHHGRFSREDFLRIAHEEMHFIRKDLSNSRKIVQVKWDERTEKWYPIAFRLMLQLMTARRPVEFATELLLPFTVDSIRESSDPWSAVMRIDPAKYAADSYLSRFDEFFSICGSQRFATSMAGLTAPTVEQAEKLIRNFSLEEVIEAARFHGDIGENKRTLDEVASREQALVLKESDATKEKLRELGARYLKKFSVKYLISAQGKSADEILQDLTLRLENTDAMELMNARGALWEISRKRLGLLSGDVISAEIEALQKKHGVVGASASITRSAGMIESVFVGEGVRSESSVTQDTWFELASLSKTIASVFALEYFRKRNIGLDASVNALLQTTASPFRLKSLDPAHPEWAEAVTILHLMKHHALNMHYVNGVPADRPMPDVGELLNGSATYGYDPIGVLHEPGSTFQYSGGGYLVLEHLIQSLEKKPIREVTAGFFRSLGLKNLSFNQVTQPGIHYANGYLTSGECVEGGRKMFPAFAAGAMGTPADVSHFLSLLTHAFHSSEGAGPISHETAVRILGGVDTSSQSFMGVNLGIGVFIAEAGKNRFAVHQGANDGFRSLFLHCFQGPDQGAGFTIFCNADTPGVLFVTEVAQLLLRHLALSGVDTTRFRGQFNAGEIPSEEVVNRAYRDLIFKAFTPDLPERIIVRGSVDPLASFNRAAEGRIIEVSNQRFALAENLLSTRLPVFDPELFGNQGKIMDSWETVRHNPRSSDTLVFASSKPAVIQYIALSTQFHLGNHAPAVKIEGRKSDVEPWSVLLPETSLEGHALKRIRVENEKEFLQFRVSMFPDGGFTRLGLFDASLPEAEKILFLPADQAKSSVFSDPIPHSARPLAPRYELSQARIERNWKAIPIGAEVDVASAAYGATLVSASNEHFGPAVQVLSPYPPLNMFDGFESARSRVKGHTEELVIRLGREARIHRIEVDFTYFKNNNPRAMSIQGLVRGAWVPLVPQTEVKAFAGNRISFQVNALDVLGQLKFTVFPDGGINRVHAFTRHGD